MTFISAKEDNNKQITVLASILCSFNANSKFHVMYYYICCSFISRAKKSKAM